MSNSSDELQAQADRAASGLRSEDDRAPHSVPPATTMEMALKAMKPNPAGLDASSILGLSNAVAKNPMDAEVKAMRPNPVGFDITSILGLSNAVAKNPMSDFVRGIERQQKMYAGLNSTFGGIGVLTSLGLRDTVAYRSVRSKEVELQNQLDQKSETISTLERSIAEAETNDMRKEEQHATEVARWKTTAAELRWTQEFRFLLDRVSPDAHEALTSSSDLRERFLEGQECDAFVVAVDIRRSTELMLKARSPDAFAEFITSLCTSLEEIVKSSYGVFDKFTGDGILAFFPNFFSGDDAAYRVVRLADQCHKCFVSLYRKHRASFTSILMDIGLCVGIDFGRVQFVRVADGLTVVGGPVVYACRLSDGPAGKTLLNQPAYEEISERISSSCFISETTISIKHEGNLLAYEVQPNGKEYEPAKPSWLMEEVNPASQGQIGAPSDVLSDSRADQQLLPGH